MGVSLQSYRMRIGMFNQRGIGKTKVAKMTTKMTTNVKMSILLQILLISICWSYCCSLNKLEHSLHGNRNIGYKIASWNCNRGLISNNIETESDKLVDIKLFIEKHKPHLMAVIESDIHGPRSRTRRQNYFTSDEIHDKLHIDGYRIELPNTWKKHDQARIIVYINDQIRAKKVDLTAEVEDLPTMTFEVGMGRERKSIVNFFYREWTVGFLV